MAKTTPTRKSAAPSVEPKPAKKAATPKKAVASKSISIEDACELALAKLREMEIEHPLQADLQWCLGSYRGDGNPIGLYQMGERALSVFQREKAAGNKAIAAKLISDLSKALKA